MVRERTPQPPISRPSPASGPGRRFRGTQIETAKDARNTVRRLLSYLRPYRLILLCVFVLALISTLLSLMGPLLIGMAIDRFITGHDIAGLLRMTFLMLGVYLGSWLSQTGQSLLMARVSQRAMRELRRHLFAHLQTLSLRFFDRDRRGELMSRLTNDMDAISVLLAQNVTALFSGLISLVGILVVMLMLNPLLTLGSMIIFPLMIGIVGIVGKRTRREFRRLQTNIGQLNATLEEMYSSQRVVIAFGQQSAAGRRFDRANETVRQVGIRAHTYAMLVPPLMGILSNANIAIVAGLGGWMTINGLASVGIIAAFIAYSRRFAAPLRQLGGLYNQIQAALAGAERIFAVIDESPELTDPVNAIVLDKIDGEVTFNNVDFAYAPNVPVLKEVSFTAEPGQTIALVGPTGAGKTTIINLLTRFYDIDNGSIRIDGHDIRTVRRENLRRQLGIVLQSTFLFAESVLENIRYGRLDATDEECIAAAKLAYADQFIRRLPQGYDTPLSERGSNLSEGQRQLLAIARAVLADPQILILDEATSSVDTRTEVYIQTALRELMDGRTSFIIAHRLSTIRHADQVLVIDDGRIIEHGTHDELLAAQGFYHQLYTSQFRGQPISTAASKGQG